MQGRRATYSRRQKRTKKFAQIRKTSNAEIKRGTSLTELLDKQIWNPRPVIGLLARAITEPDFSLLLVLVNGVLLTAAAQQTCIMYVCP
jgi:hypothetical protein